MSRNPANSRHSHSSWLWPADWTRNRGQALVETALVLPILLLVIGGIVQFGMLFWTQNTLTQIARDTGRWAATQQVKPCADGDVAVANQADLIAQQSSLLGFTTGEWASLGPYEYQVDPQPAEGVEVAWAGPPGLLPEDCPPIDNAQAWFVTIRVNHEVDVFFPGMAFVCGGGDSCQLSSATQFRMEPAP
jgi:hypothetical protein